MAGAKTNRILLGRIAGAHGIRGDVLIHTFTERAGEHRRLRAARRRAGARTYEIQSARADAQGRGGAHQGRHRPQRRGSAQGRPLYVDRDRLPAAAEGEYYHADLIGLAAVDGAGKAVGEIIAVHNFGAGDLLEIRLAGSSKTELVPFTDDAVPEVDIGARRVVVVLPTPDE